MEIDVRQLKYRYGSFYVLNATDIPKRLRCINNEEPYVCGAVDVIDDESLLTQALINAIVIGNAITVKLTASKDASSTDSNAVVKLKAECSVNADITIKRGSDIVDTATDVSTLVTAHVFTPDTSTLLDTYTAEFKIGEFIKTATVNVGIIFAICDEDWINALGVSPDNEDTYILGSPVGTYNINVDKYISVASPGPFHVYFIVPRSMNINSAVMGGFNFPLQSAIESTFQGANCKYYESSNDYPTGTLTIKIS